MCLELVQTGRVIGSCEDGFVNASAMYVLHVSLIHFDWIRADVSHCAQHCSKPLGGLSECMMFWSSSHVCLCLACAAVFSVF